MSRPRSRFLFLMITAIGLAMFQFHSPSTAAENSAKVEVQSIYPSSIYPTPENTSQYFLDSDGNVLLSFAEQPTSSSWYSLNTFIDGILKGIPGFNVIPSQPTFTNSWVHDSLAPGIFLIKDRVDCLLVQGEGCTPRTGLINKVVKSDGTVINPNIDFGLYNEKNIAGIMDGKILFYNSVDLGDRSKKERKRSTQYSLFDVSNYASAKNLWQSQVIEGIIPDIREFGGTEAHLFTDGSALIQLDGISGDYKNCKNFLKLNSSGQIDNKWVEDVQNRIVAKGGKSGFPLSWIWTAGKRTAPNRIIFFARTYESQNDCKGHMGGNQVNIVTNNSGELVDVILDPENSFDYADEVVECNESIGCIWSNGARELSWADFDMKRISSAPWFKLAPPKDFVVNFLVFDRVSRQQMNVPTVVTNWSGSELIGIKNRTATYLITASYLDRAFGISGYKTFIAQYIIPDDLYKVQAKINAEKEAKLKAEERAKSEAAKARALESNQSKLTTFICSNGKKTTKVKGKNPKCPKGYKKIL